MDINEYFENITIEEIQKFVDEGQEENVNLEFKTVSHPNYNNENREFDKKNYSEVISGFANSNGGIIIWGIKAKENDKKQDVAKSLSPIKELTRFLNFLNRLEGQAVTPIVIGIKHVKIETSDDEGFIKTYVPRSDDAPHMANYSGKRYYKRSGDSFYICEHYDIRDMFNRKNNANVELIISEKVEKDKIAKGYLYLFTIQLQNTGKGIAKAPQLIINIGKPYKLYEYGIDGNGNVGLFNTRAKPRLDNKGSYMGGQDTIIFPELLYSIDKVSFFSETELKELPELVIDYIIVAENMGIVNGEKKIKISP